MLAIQTRHPVLGVKYLLCTCLLFIITEVSAQQPIVQMDLKKVVELAQETSLSALRSRNTYMASHWEYQTFKANRLPSLNLNMVPISYNRDYTRRYDSQLNIDVYRRQQSVYSYGALGIQQNFDLTGGSFFVDSELGYFRNLGNTPYNQYSSVPVRIGYRQEFLGYNGFKWERKIAPVKFDKAKKQLLYDLEESAEIAAAYFFDLAMAQAELSLAAENYHSSDTLFKIGEEKFKIASIGRSDLLALKLDFINAQNNLQNAEINVKNSRFLLTSFLNLGKETEIALKIPASPGEVVVSTEEAIKIARENNPLYTDSKFQISQSEQAMERMKIESKFNVGISASIGFNQVAETLAKSYRDPLQQDIVSLTLSIPLVDWGVRKGRYNIAKNNLNISKLSAAEREVQLEQEISMAVEDLKIQKQLISVGNEATELARMAFEQTKERFIIGKADIASLTLAANRRQQIQRNYLLALKKYWQSHFRIRKITLFDFSKRISIGQAFDWNTMKIKEGYFD